MTRPDPASDLVGFLRVLGQQLDAVSARLEALSEEIGTKTWTIADLSRVEGVSASSIRQNPWRMPNFGRPDIPGNALRWYSATVKEWLSKPLTHYRDEWEAMDFNARRRARTGRAA